MTPPSQTTPPDPTTNVRNTAATRLDPELARAGRRITGAVFAAQALGSAGVIGIATVATIVGADLSGRTGLAGVPGAVFALGTALAALPWSLATDAIGRRGGLALGGAVGAIGAVGAVAAFLAGSFPLLLLALAVAGSGQAAFRLGRFAAAEATPPAKRGRAVATVVLAGAAGSVLGPQLLPRAGRVAELGGADPLVGAYAVAVICFVLAAAVLALLLRPDPREVARQLDALEPHPAGTAARRPRELLADGGVVRAIVAMVLAQGVMLLVMGITALHMRDNGHALTAISWVFSAHTLGMFGFSLATGWLVDRWGRLPTIRLGAGLLIVSCVAAPISTAVGPLVVALFLLGLGWNLAYVGGSSLLSDRLAPAERARIQGVNDLLIGGAAATASVGRG